MQVKFGRAVLLIDPQSPGHLRQGGQQAAINGRQAAQKLGVLACLQRHSLLCEFAHDPLQHAGVEDARGLAQRTLGSTRTAKLLLDVRKATRLLQCIQTGNDGIEKEQQNKRGVLIVKQGPVVCPITVGADIMQPGEQGLKPLEVLQPLDIVGANLASAYRRHSAHPDRQLSTRPTANMQSAYVHQNTAAFMPEQAKKKKNERNS
jgi:hypothetical protein